MLRAGSSVMPHLRTEKPSLHQKHCMHSPPRPGSRALQALQYTLAMAMASMIASINQQPPLSLNVYSPEKCCSGSSAANSIQPLTSASSQLSVISIYTMIRHCIICSFHKWLRLILRHCTRKKNLKLRIWVLTVIRICTLTRFLLTTTYTIKKVVSINSYTCTFSNYIGTLCLMSVYAM